MSGWDKFMRFAEGAINFGQQIVSIAAEKQGKQIAFANAKLKRETGREMLLGGKSLQAWEREWQHLGCLATASLSHLSDSVGLYRAKLGGKTVYVGRAVEYSNGGLRKRLSDYTRESDSARKHGSGRKMHENASRLSIDILVTGRNSESADVARKLESYFIGKYKPEWNRQLL